MGAIGTRDTQTVSKSGALNSTLKLSRRATGDIGGAQLTAATISFTASDTISDSGNGLAVFGVGDTVLPVGSPLNNRRWTVLTVAAGSITVAPSQVQTEAAGETISLRKVV